MSNPLTPLTSTPACPCCDFRIVIDFSDEQPLNDSLSIKRNFDPSSNSTSRIDENTNVPKLLSMREEKLTTTSDSLERLDVQSPELSSNLQTSIHEPANTNQTIQPK
jgi:hypothetical protein